MRPACVIHDSSINRGSKIVRSKLQTRSQKPTSVWLIRNPLDKYISGTHIACKVLQLESLNSTIFLRPGTSCYDNDQRCCTTQVHVEWTGYVCIGSQQKKIGGVRPRPTFVWACSGFGAQFHYLETVVLHDNLNHQPWRKSNLGNIFNSNDKIACFEKP
ncbi:hypothetical protein BJY04DRAFT_109744 [Aspergillus karnatakaensis]|uniref:uncharacterized protein n=1 Tax=Aspergillus karnatakaensis TaxID=1810916 RepID=UPI003CCD4E6E